jgi:hypothetical protein
MHYFSTPLPYKDRIPTQKLFERFALFFAAMVVVQMATVSLLLRPKIRVNYTMTSVYDEKIHVM